MGKTITIYNNRLGDSPGAGSGNKVTLHGVSIDDDFQKELKEIKRAWSKSNWSKESVIYFIDLKRIRRAITITAWITANSTENDDQVADNLRKIVGGGGICKLNVSEWNSGNDIDVQVLKMKISEKASDSSTSTDTEKSRYQVTMMCVEGVDR